jgi:hypothetical protein
MVCRLASGSWRTVRSVLASTVTVVVRPPGASTLLSLFAAL